MAFILKSGVVAPRAPDSTTGNVVRSSFWLLPVSILFLVGMWQYADRILVPYQISDAALHGRPRGNLSDLYPRWLGARELLVDGKTGDESEYALEGEKGYYGRVLDAS